MKTHKKIVALAIALIFAFSSLVSVTSFAADDDLFSDVGADNKYYEAISSLVSDGVINGYEDGTFKPENTITRAEFSKLLAVGSTPKGTPFTATTTQFSDVADSTSSSAWAIPYIAYAVSTKAVNGYPDGTFGPTNPVTYGEAVKMIVCTLGYGSVANTNLTPWYQGYIDIAFQIGLNKNAIAQGDAPAPRGLVAQLIYNMQSCPQYIPSTNGGPGYSGSWGDSGLTNEESEDGILLGVFDFCLTGDSLTKSQVLIDDEIYQIGDLDIEDLKKLVGYAVSFKYTDNKKPELTRVSKATGENDDFELEEWQIASLDRETVEYYEDQDAYDEDEISKAKLASDFYVVYNGVVVDPSEIDDEFINDYLNIENGTVTFVSNDGSAKNFEVAYVESYITYFVSTSTTSDGITTFYDKFTSHTGLEALALDEDDVASVTKVTSKGGNLNDSTLSGITKNSVTSIAIPYKTTEGTVVKISTATTTGTVKEIKNDYSFVKIGTERFEFAPYFKLLLEKGEDVELSINDSGKFYLDYLGRIVFFEKTESTNPYALLVEYKQGSNMNSAYRVNILNSSKGLSAFKLKDTVRVNGKSMDAEETIAFLIDNAPYYDEENPSYIIQPIKYKTSTSNGETVISEIECMDSNDYEDGNIVPYAFKNSKNTEAEYFANGGMLKYSKSGYAFKHSDSTQFRMNSSTVVFVVPNDLSKSDSFTKKTYSYFTDTSSYKVEAYDVNKDIAKVVVVYGSSSKPTVYGQTSVYLVQDITEKNNSEGQPTKNIVYIKTGSTEEEEKLVANETEILDKVEEIQVGDLIKFATEDNEIVDIKKVYSTNEEELYNETGSWKVNGHHITKAYSTSSSDLYEAIYGSVVSADIDENTISLVAGLASDDDFDPSAYDTLNITDSTVFYKYSEKNGFEVSSIGEIAGRGYSDFEESGEDVAKENAANIVTIIMDNKVVAVYILEK